MQSAKYLRSHFDDRLIEVEGSAEVYADKLLVE